MSNEVFVDTGAWVALADARDQMHRAATALYPSVLEHWASLVTTNLVVGESYTLIRRRLGHSAAIRFLEALRKAPRLVKVYSHATLEAEAQEILRHYADHDFSFTDAVSFAVMRARGIAEAFAFDRHFQTAGFAALPATGP